MRLTRRLFNYLRHRLDVALLALALLLLIAALFKPTVPVKRDIYSYMLVADISQSMNAPDMRLGGKDVSRLVYMKDMMRRVVASMPCGTSVSVSVFAGVTIAAMYQPLEVCANYANIQDTISNMDWRMAWSGNSRIRSTLPSIARTIRSFPAPAQVVLFTDGEEAPRLHAFNTENLESFQGGAGWLIVGIGSDKGTPIPKLDEQNQLIGFWSNESFALQPGIAQISESNIGTRDDNVALGETDRYQSKLDEEYLKTLSAEVEASYVRGDNLQTVLAAMKAQKPARRETAGFELRWILAALAALTFVTAFLPRHPVQTLRAALASRLRRRVVTS
ncbi:VWA domain-containing protein [Pseudomethylobacillus aquaticus]|uniref:VWA domain-containing protein n=1 Tax=Pseudomethylobacillus aquaticus TaxID=2676064 RepID=A0A3N0V5V4_9PROT|nr:VWA domain-containing protein [Pseudomethylobacillus aquaticus]ROH88190.1 VWA domain-containing protein [Pseudomethylobacillus aquaticus]